MNILAEHEADRCRCNECREPAFLLINGRCLRCDRLCREEEDRWSEHPLALAERRELEFPPMDEATEEPEAEDERPCDS